MRMGENGKGADSCAETIFAPTEEGGECLPPSSAPLLALFLLLIHSEFKKFQAVVMQYRVTCLVG